MMTSNHGFVYPSLVRSFARARARGKRGRGERRAISQEGVLYGMSRSWSLSTLRRWTIRVKFKNYELRVKSRRVDLFTSIARSSYITGKREKTCRYHHFIHPDLACCLKRLPRLPIRSCCCLFEWLSVSVAGLSRLTCHNVHRFSHLPSYRVAPICNASPFQHTSI